MEPHTHARAGVLPANFVACSQLRGEFIVSGSDINIHITALCQRKLL